MMSIKRTHGLGNLIMLLPVLDKLVEDGVDVHLVTRPEWASAIRLGRPKLNIDARTTALTVDLDAATFSARPSRHRTLEFAAILGVSEPFCPPILLVSPAWQQPFRQHAGSLILAPEAGHPARSWQKAQLVKLASGLGTRPVVLTGLSLSPPLPCSADLRGKLQLCELLGLLSLASSVVCFDSGMLHLALALRVPTLAIFGGIDPAFRILPDQPARIIQADMPCSPCNKAETCNGLYPCLTTLDPEKILAELATLESVNQREILRKRLTVDE